MIHEGKSNSDEKESYEMLTNVLSIFMVDDTLNDNTFTLRKMEDHAAVRNNTFFFGERLKIMLN